MKHVYMIIKKTTDGGFYRFDTSGPLVYETREMAAEDLSRFLMGAEGYCVLELPVVDEPQLLGHPGQREAWEAEHPKFVYSRTLREKAKELLARATEELGTLRGGERVDLLLDNFSCLRGSGSAMQLLKEVDLTK